MVLRSKKKTAYVYKKKLENLSSIEMVLRYMLMVLNVIRLYVGH